MKSTTIGGVETLIREIQSSYREVDVIELYQDSPREEKFPENPKVDYLSYGRAGSPSIFYKVLTKLNQRDKISSVNEKYDANTIVIFHPNDLLYMPHKVRKSARIILVQTNRLDIYFAKLETLVMHLLARYVDLFTVYTVADKHAVDKFYGKWFRAISVIPRGCKLKTAKSIPSRKKKLITIARIHEHQKNFKGLVEVVKKLPSDYTLSIYGDGPTEEVNNLKHLIKTVPNIKFHGATSDVTEALREHSLFVMSSHYEGFGQTLIEARSQGLPIVAFRTFDALSWIIKEDSNGKIISAYDTSAFADAIVNILESDAIFESMATNALRYAKETEKENINRIWSSALTYE